jgi:hypothetical protein
LYFTANPNIKHNPYILIPSTLSEIYSNLNDPFYYKNAIKARVAKIILGSSVIRVFKGGSKISLTECLGKIDVDYLLKISSRKEYDAWHLAGINKIYSCLKKEPVNIDRLSKEGLKWGHSTKIFNLFIGHLVTMSPYFDKTEDYERIRFYLHVPLDSKAFEVLRDCGIKHVPKNIKQVTQKDYKNIQALLFQASEMHNIPALHFDEYAWALEKEI